MRTDSLGNPKSAPAARADSAAQPVPKGALKKWTVQETRSWKKSFVRNYDLYLLLIPVIAYFVVFSYGPMSVSYTHLDVYKRQVPYTDLPYHLLPLLLPDIFFLLRSDKVELHFCWMNWRALERRMRRPALKKSCWASMSCWKGCWRMSRQRQMDAKKPRWKPQAWMTMCGTRMNSANRWTALPMAAVSLAVTPSG